MKSLNLSMVDSISKKFRSLTCKNTGFSINSLKLFCGKNTGGLASVFLEADHRGGC